MLGCHVGVVIPSPAGPNAANRLGADHSSDRRQHKEKRGGARYKTRGNGGGGFGFGGRSLNAAGLKEKHGRDDVDEMVRGKERGPATAAVLHADEERNSSEPQASGCGIGDAVVGERAWIEVSGEKRHWQTGRAFVFDPSFFHRTHNPTSGERVILNLDIWHPGLKEVEKTAIRRVCELVEQWNARSGLFEEHN